MEVYLSISFLATELYQIIQILKQLLGVEILHYFYPNKNFYIIVHFFNKRYGHLKE